MVPYEGKRISPVPLSRQGIRLARQPTLGIEDRPGLEHLVGRVPVKLGQDSQVCLGPSQCPPKNRRLTLCGHHIFDFPCRAELCDKRHLTQRIFDGVGKCHIRVPGPRLPLPQRLLENLHEARAGEFLRVDL